MGGKMVIWGEKSFWLPLKGPRASLLQPEQVLLILLLALFFRFDL